MAVRGSDWPCRKASHRTSGEASSDRCGEEEEVKRNRRRGSSDAGSR